MTYVIDTNIAFEIAFNGIDSAYYKKLLLEAEEVIAPTIFQSEVTNVLWEYVKRGYIDEQNAKITMLHIFQLVDNYIETADLVVESLHESIWLKESVYDMQYLVAARRNGATLLTKDRKLFEKAKGCGVLVL